MRITPKIVGAFIATAIGMQVLVSYVLSNDDALAGLQPFLVKTKDITSVTGERPTISVHNASFYEGVPGKENPYREYRITANGSQGKVDLTIRAYKAEDEGSWSYQVKAFRQ